MHLLYLSVANSRHIIGNMSWCAAAHDVSNVPQRPTCSQLRETVHVWSAVTEAIGLFQMLQFIFSRFKVPTHCFGIVIPACQREDLQGGLTTGDGLLLVGGAIPRQVSRYYAFSEYTT